MKTVLKIAAGMGAAGLILILVISLISGKTSLTSEDLGINVNQLANGIGMLMQALASALVLFIITLAIMSGATNGTGG